MSLHHSVQALTDNVQKTERNHDKVMLLWNLVGPTLIVLIIFLAVIIFTGDAHAAANSSDWTKPATGIIETLKSGLVTIGALVVGLAVIGAGIWMSMTGEPNLKRLGVMIFGGVLIMAGPAAIATILEAAK